MKKSDKYKITIRETRLRSFVRKQLINEVIAQDLDQKYLEAVRAGNIKKAWGLVRQAFKQAFPNTRVVDYDRNPKEVYHGTSNGKFNVFDKEKIGDKWNADEVGFFFTDDIGIGNDYTKPFPETKPSNPYLFKVFLNITHPFVIDNKWFRKNYGRSIMQYDAIEVWDCHQEDILEVLRQGDYDGVIIDTKGMGMPQPIMYVVFEPGQIKSAEVFEYDDNGKLIPLSQRFSNSDDIRYEEE